ncbi:MAG: hypothetical protein EPO57_01580 [Chitinophagaceae bacterium]|nr:MAG: hypothetical protein EPO57_01580 [Chitinophagaceae bacterium]
MNSKLIVRGLVGGLSYFLLGWVVWGMLLKNFMMAHSSPGAASVFRAEDDFIWWAMILGNLSLGFLQTYVLSKAKINDLKASALTCAMVGMLISAGSDFMMYAHMNLSDVNAIVVDILAMTLVSGVVGAILSLLKGSD